MNIKDTTTFGPVQILMLKGEQGDPGKPTDEQVTSAVNAWLDEHPEATTTVQDGSITIDKLSSDLRSELFVGNDDIAEASVSALSSTASSGFLDNNFQMMAGKALKDISKLSIQNTFYAHRLSSTQLRLSKSDIELVKLYINGSAVSVPVESYDIEIVRLITTRPYGVQFNFVLNYAIPQNAEFQIYVRFATTTPAISDMTYYSSLQRVADSNCAAIQIGATSSEGGEINYDTTSYKLYAYTVEYYNEKRKGPIELIDALTTRVDALDARVTASSGSGLTFEPDFEPFSAAEGLVATKVGSVCNVSGSIMPTSDVVVSSASVVASFDGTEFISPRGIYAPAYIIGMGAVPKLAFWIVGGIISLSTISGDPVTIPAGTRIVLNTTWLE